MSVLVKIPVKPFMKGYIQSYYNSSIISLAQNHPDCLFLYPLLQKQPLILEEKEQSLQEKLQDEIRTLRKAVQTADAVYRAVRHKYLDMSEFSEHISIVIPPSLRDHKRFYISNKNIWRFHNRFFDIFKKEFFAYMDKNYICDKQKLNDIIYNFMTLYNWTEDDIRVDALRKLYYRERTDKRERVTIPVALLTSGNNNAAMLLR